MQLTSRYRARKLKRLLLVGLIQSLIIGCVLATAAKLVEFKLDEEFKDTAQYVFENHKENIRQEIYINSVIHESKVEELPSIAQFIKSLKASELNFNFEVVECSSNVFLKIDLPNHINGICFNVYRINNSVFNLLKFIVPILIAFLLISVPVYYFLLKSVEQEEKLTLESSFLEEIRHNLNSPLLVLQTLIDSDNYSVEFKQHYEYNINLIRKYFNQMRNDDRTLDRRSYFQPSSVIEFVVQEKTIEFSTSGKFIDFILKDETSESFIYFDRDEFTFIISNLINNSFAAIDINGTIEITLSEESGNVLINILDNGKGISDQYLSSIFKRGFSTKGLFGSGLGLSHAREQISKENGKIEIINSNPGVLVTIALPSKGGKDWPVYILEDDRYSSMNIKLRLSNDNRITGRKIEILQSVESILSQFEKCAGKCFLILDSNIKNDPSAGKELARKLLARGQCEIFMHSGYERNYFEDLKGLRGVLAKNNNDIYRLLRSISDSFQS